MRVPHVVLILAFVAAASSPLRAQWPRHLPTAVPKGADGKVDMTAPPPRTADGKIDFSGVWETFSPRPATARPPAAGTGAGAATGPAAGAAAAGAGARAATGAAAPAATGAAAGTGAAIPSGNVFGNIGAQ